MNSEKLLTIKLFSQLPANEQEWLKNIADTYPLSFQQLKMLTEFSADMECWQLGSVNQFYQPEKLIEIKGKKAAAVFFKQIKTGYDQLVNREKLYPAEPAKTENETQFPSRQIIKTELQGSIMGTCPVASKKTRCCNLKTLDAVQQCGFACSYCSIQSFYHGNQVRFIENLSEHLNNLQLDPQQIYHIGTGQSSDSLMWGNSHGLLDELSRFARKSPNVILEMKSKSGRVDYFLENPPPFNMLFSWSVNPQIVIQHEELGTASLTKRLEAARIIADQGKPVGFHFHPVIWYKGWEQDYIALVNELTEQFQPEEVVMVSLGTLTFIKSVIKRIRSRLLKSSILQMPFEEIGGKLSYPFGIKKDMFSTVYQAFPESWHENVFFYMCMEDIDLWPLVFGREYKTNEDFEQDMLRHYSRKIKAIDNRIQLLSGNTYHNGQPILLRNSTVKT